MANASETQAFKESVEPLVIQLQRATDIEERRLTSAELVHAVSSHFKRFFPMSEAVDLVEIITIYRELGKDE
ncbi:MAG: hypothetical protein JNK70_00500 [Phycisphaerae bacterium]|nr:hypothetical protein [Phycisphaerae bacterium]